VRVTQQQPVPQLNRIENVQAIVGDFGMARVDACVVEQGVAVRGITLGFWVVKLGVGGRVTRRFQGGS